MSIYTIIVTYNGSKWIKKCLDSVYSSRIESKIVIVDNNSTDDTISIIRNNFKNVILFCLNKNLGFGRANNIGIIKALNYDPQYVFLLNQDAEVKKDTIEKLISKFENHPEFSILSPMHYFDSNHLDAKFKKYYERGVKIDQNLTEVNFVNAALWLVRTNDLKRYGIFNECFVHYGEDIELCRRFRSFNKKIGIVNNSLAFHKRPQNEITYSQINLEKNSEIRILLPLIGLKFNFLKSFFELSRFIIFGNKNINSRSNFGFLKRFKSFNKAFKNYISNNNNHLSLK